MHYADQFLVTAGSTKAKPSTLDIKITPGVLHSGIFFFPAGCRGTVHIALAHAIHQVWPTNPSGTFAFENYVHRVDDYYQIPPGVITLQLRGYCVNCDENHKIQWAFSINRPEEIFPMLYGPIRNLEEVVEFLKIWIPPLPTPPEEEKTIG